MYINDVKIFKIKPSPFNKVSSETNFTLVKYGKFHFIKTMYLHINSSFNYNIILIYILYHYTSEIRSSLIIKHYQNKIIAFD